MMTALQQDPPILSLSKDARGTAPQINPHRVCFDKLGMSGIRK